MSAPATAPAHRAPKHRRPTTPVVLGWTRWPKHRDPAAGPAAADGLEEDRRQWVAAMKLDQTRRTQRAKAMWS